MMDGALEPEGLVVGSDGRDLCQQIAKNDPRCCRVSLTSSLVRGVLYDSFCDQVANSLADNRFVTELVVTSPPIDPGPGARSLAAWVARSHFLRKVTILGAHKSSTSPENDNTLPRDASQHIASFASVFVSATERLSLLDIRFVDLNVKDVVVALYGVLISTVSLKELRLGFPGASEGCAIPNAVTEEDCRLVKDGLARNASLTSIMLLRSSAVFVGACADGLSGHAALKALTVAGTGADEKVSNSIGSLLAGKTGLNYLCMRETAVSSLFCQGLAQNSSLEHLVMDKIPFENVGPLLSAALERNTGLQQVHFSNHILDGQSLVGLIPSLVRMNAVALSYCGVEDRVDSLQPLLRSSHLTTLNLSGNFLGGTGTEGIREIAEGFAGNGSLQEVDFASCQLGDEKVTILVDSLLSLTALSRCNIESNQIGVLGARTLARCLQLHPSLRVLDASFNCIQDEGAAALADALLDSTVEELNLADCEIRDSGLSAFSRALQERRHRTLCVRLEENRFGPMGYRSLANAFPDITCLDELSIDLPIESEPCMSALVSSILKNSSLSKFSRLQHDQSAKSYHWDTIDFAICRNHMKRLMESGNFPTAIVPEAIGWLNRKPVHRKASSSAIYYMVKRALAGIIDEGLLPRKRKQKTSTAEL